METNQQIDDGGPAFPHIIKSWANDNTSQPHAGMSLRDHFAGLAMHATIMRIPLAKLKDRNGAMPTVPLETEQNGADIRRATADLSYAYADAMLAARKSTPTA